MKTLNESKPFYLRFTDIRADKVFITLECLYGFAQTKTGTLERIVNHELPWSSIGIHHPLSRNPKGGGLFEMMGTWNFELVNSKFLTKLELELSKIQVFWQPVGVKARKTGRYVTVSTRGEATGLTPTTTAASLAKLGKAGIVKETTGGKYGRLYAYGGYLKILAPLE
ncbi:MAG: hypothetical protein FJ385_01575 [Verrucomicrobia bacterium]|nr:hypothetical protein [Verrucomicrobiota bacterium]